MFPELEHENKLVEVSFRANAEQLEEITRKPEMVFNAMIKRRKAEVKVSTLKPEQRKELEKAKDRELNTWLKYAVVTAASRQGLSPSALMKMRWVVTFKEDGQLKARLVVQGFTDKRLGTIPTSSPTASRRSRQLFLCMAGSLGFQTHKGDVKCAFLQGDLDEEGSAEKEKDRWGEDLQNDTFCEPVPELSKKMGLEHHQCVKLLKAVYGLVNAPRRWYHRVSTDLKKLGGEESQMEPCLWTLRDKDGQIVAMCLVYVDDVLLAVSDSAKGQKIFQEINDLYE